MYRTYLYGKLSQKATSVKLFSVRKGRIALNTLEDAMIYASTQGLDFEEYAKKDAIAYYAIELAELLSREGHYWLAAKCYFEALSQSWRDYIDVEFYGKVREYRKAISPEEVYQKALKYLVSIKELEWQEEFKRENLEWRECAIKIRVSQSKPLSDGYSEEVF